MRGSEAAASVLKSELASTQTDQTSEVNALALRGQFAEDQRICDHIVDSVARTLISVNHIIRCQKLTRDRQSYQGDLACR